MVFGSLRSTHWGINENKWDKSGENGEETVKSYQSPLWKSGWNGKILPKPSLKMGKKWWNTPPSTNIFLGSRKEEEMGEERARITVNEKSKCKTGKKKGFKLFCTFQTRLK